MNLDIQNHGSLYGTAEGRAKDTFYVLHDLNTPIFATAAKKKKKKKATVYIYIGTGGGLLTDSESPINGTVTL